MLFLAFSRLAAICFSVVIVLGPRPLSQVEIAIQWDVFAPSMQGARKRVDFELLPPGNFISGLMELPVVAPAERNGEFIADLEPQCAGLRKAQMMGVAGMPSANQAGL